MTAGDAVNSVQRVSAPPSAAIDDVGDVTVDHVLGIEHDGADGLARGQLFQRVGVRFVGGQQREFGQGRPQQRGGHQGPAEFADDGGGVREFTAGPAEFLGHHQRRDTHLLAQQCPQRFVIAALGLHRGAHRFRAGVLADEVPDGLGEQGTFVRHTHSASSTRRRCAVGSPQADRSACARSSKQAEVVLLGEADRSVGLQCRPRRQQSGFGRRYLRRADIACGVGGIGAQRQRRAVDQRPGEFQRDVHVGELVLDGLVGPDQSAELRALLGVCDRRVQHRLPRADQLRGGGQGAVLAGPLHVGRPSGAGSADVEQLSARVQGITGVAGDAVVHLITVGDEDQPGEPGVHRTRHLRCDGRRGDQFAGSQCGAAVIRGQQDRRDGDRFGDRAGHTVRADALQGHHQIHRVGSDSVVVLADGQGGDAEVGQRRPDLPAGAGVTGGPGTHRRGYIGRAERGVDTGREVALLFV